MLWKQFWAVYSPDDVTGGAPDAPTPPVVESGKTADAELTLDAMKEKLAELEKYNTDLRKENEKRRKAEEATSARLAAEETKRLESAGEWQKLAEDRAKELEALKAVKEKADKFEAQIKATNEARVKRIPDALRSVVPTGYTPEQLAEWLDKNETVLAGRVAPNLDAGDKGERGKKPVDSKTVLKKQAY